MSGAGAGEALYTTRAGYYDAIYHWKEYDEEAARIRALLAAEGIADGARVLDAGCGTGAHLERLAPWYEVSGFDRSEEMLALARARLPGVPLFRADFTDFTVPEPADALLCLFSSIGYVYPEARLRAAAARFAAAVRPGGALVVEPWLAPEDFEPGHASMDVFRDDDLKLCRASISRREGELSVIDFHWLAVREGAAEVERFEERHVLWLCPRALMMEIFDAAGFTCRLAAEGPMGARGAIVGRRR